MNCRKKLQAFKSQKTKSKSSNISNFIYILQKKKSTITATKLPNSLSLLISLKKIG